MAAKDDVDVRLDAYCAKFPQTPEQRALLRELLVSQRDADVERRERDAELLLPESAQRALAAERQALRLQSEGHDADAIEEWQFDGLPPGAPRREIYKRVINLRQGRRDVGLGTMALVSAAREGVERGRSAAQRTTLKVTAEADRFAVGLTREWLRVAGWEDEL